MGRIGELEKRAAPLVMLGAAPDDAVLEVSHAGLKILLGR
jgi:hypothetical protein